MLYKNLELLPIYNYYKILKTGDISWLGEGATIELWNEIKLQIPNINLSIDKAYFKCFELYLRYLKNEIDIQLVHKQFGLYRDTVNHFFKEFEFEGTKYDNCNELYKYLSNNMPIDWDIYEQLIIFNIDNIVTQVNDYDLYAECVQLEQILGLQIDVNTCPTLKYFAYQKSANEKIKQLKTK